MKTCIYSNRSDEMGIMELGGYSKFKSFEINASKKRKETTKIKRK